MVAGIIVVAMMALTGGAIVGRVVVVLVADTAGGIDSSGVGGCSDYECFNYDEICCTNTCTCILIPAEAVVDFSDGFGVTDSEAFHLSVKPSCEFLQLGQRQA